MNEAENLGPEEAKEPIWDEDYDDRSADTVFVPSDEVHFRVHSWQLKKKSGFATGMFEVASNDDPAQQPLQLDTSARVLRIFFDALFSSGKPVIDSSDQDADDLLGLADKFQSPAVKDKILDALVHSPLVGKDPKRYFFLAARMARPSLARRAAEQMNDPIEDWTAEDVNEAGGRYFLALLWSAMRQEMLGVHYHGPPRWVTDPWAKVGDSLDRHLR